MSLIEDYAIIGDLLTAALVGKDGSIDWLCFPHFDSPACFAALLDSEEAGRWLLAPTSDESRCTRRYLDDTLVLETRWETDTGAVLVIDFMPPRGEAPDIVRIVEGISGEVAMRGELKIRFGYGKITPWVRSSEAGMSAIAGPDSLYLVSTAPLEGRGMATVSEFSVRAGQRHSFVLTWNPSHLERPEPVPPEQALTDTLAYWQEWSGRSKTTGPYRAQVQRSLITLKALTFAPTGGIVAAATTSLPEQIGGPRNWDYRYCWLRDASLTLQALLSAGYTDEAQAWRDWLLRAVAGDPADLQIMYSIMGERYLPEAELGWLKGYEDSLPVRIGNAAADQLQLDVWGELLDGLALTRNALMHPNDSSWDIQLAIMQHLETIWEQPDNGLWEMRGKRQHFTYSKVMAWVATDRMVRAIEKFDLPGPVERWRALRETIRAQVMEQGFNAELNTFTQAYGSTELDASLLLLARAGFIEPNDPRFVATIEAVRQHLTHDGFVLRYRTASGDDGLPAGEGVFIACSFWLVDALNGAGRRTEALALFERLLELCNDVGLLSEEWDPVGKRHLGNTPQAFSHLSLIMSAAQLELGESHRTDNPDIAR